MARISHDEVLIALLGWLFLMVFVGMIGVWGWAIWRLLTGRRILPEQPMVSGGRATWGVGTVLLVLLLYVVVSFAEPVGLSLGGRPAARRSPPPRREPWPSLWPIRLQSHKEKERRPTPIRTRPSPRNLPPTSPGKNGNLSLQTEVMFLVSVIDSVLLVLIPLLVRLTSGARLRDLGICLDGWMRQAALGVGATLFVAPIIYAVQLVVLLIWPADPSNDHPLKKMLEEQFTAGVVYLAIVSAVILAPMLEELMFRAIFQGWLSAWLARHRNALSRRSAETLGTSPRSRLTMDSQPIIGSSMPTPRQTLGKGPNSSDPVWTRRTASPGRRSF